MISWAKVFSFACILVIFISCKKDQPAPLPEGIVINKNVKVINNNTWEEQIISLDSSNYTIVFSKNIESTLQFEVGDIVVSAVGEGLLRKVKAVSSLNNNLTLQTEPATLTEMIQQGIIDFKEPLKVSQIKSIENCFSGVKLNIENVKGSEQTQFNWDINSVIYDYDSNPGTTGDQIKLIGSFNCEWEFAFKIDVGISGNLKEVKIGYESAENLDLQLITGLQYNLEKKITLATVNFMPIIVNVGIVPVVFTPKLKISVGVDGSASASVTSEITQSISFNAGIQYLKSQGWTPYNTFNKNLGFQPPHLNMNANAVAYLKPELSVEIYDIAGPYVNLKLYGRIDANILQTPWWQLYGGLTMDAGAKVDIIDKFLLEYTVSDLINYEQLLAQATTLPVSLPIVSTAPVLELNSTSASVGGNVTNDQGSPIIERGIYWGISQYPEANGTKLQIEGEASSFSTTLSGLIPGTTYYIKAYAINSQGTGYGGQVSFTTSSGGQSGIVTDFEGNSYNTVTIGTQTWMAENLASTKYNDGSVIPSETDNYTWWHLTTPGVCWYANDMATYKTIYGALYNWYAIDAVSNGVKNICPVNWHVPTNSDWITLITYLGGENEAGAKLKEIDTNHWLLPNTGATNESGFTALPGGKRDNPGAFGMLGMNGYWWSATDNDATSAWSIDLYYGGSNVGRNYNPKINGYSVRCIKD